MTRIPWLAVSLLLVVVVSACEAASLDVQPSENLDVAVALDLGAGADVEVPDVRDSADANDVSDVSARPDAAEADVIAPPAYSGSAGCSAATGLTEGEHTFMLEGRERRFIVRLPTGYAEGGPWPLVFALHGNGGSAGYWDGTSGGRNIRGVLADDAVLVVTEAIEGNWRDYNADSSTWPARIESELAYFDELIRRTTAELCIDERAMFSMGFSGGGSFSGVLGCRRTDIRGIAVGGSVIYFDESKCVGAPAAWVTIGEQELSGGREAYRDFFRARAGCQTSSTAVAPAPCQRYDGCSPSTPVDYCEHPDGHIWPDFGSDAMWAFFRGLIEYDAANR